ITKVEAEDVGNVTDFRQHLSQPGKVLSAIKDASNGLTHEELAADTGISGHSLRTVLSRLILKQRISEHNGKLYLIAKEG
ncbi:MAG: hypothetical protein Q7O66_09510, partial [Dehalococcoidia bacterium]|nr:hypothetical protein [Dehalococcoidia bacterium]